MSDYDTYNTGREIQQNNAFHRLVGDLSVRLGQSSGLTSDDVKVEELQSLMENYDSKSIEWEDFAFRDFTRNYTRNLVDKGNGKSNL